MSHKATNWAFEQTDLEPALMIVLLRLADCHNPDYGGAFPSQERLAEMCKVSRSALNKYLERLEELGLIARERRRKPGSTRQDRTRYYFPFEPLFSQFCSKVPSPRSGHGDGKAESTREQKPSPQNGKSRVQNLDSNPVREPVTEPVTEKDPRETRWEPRPEWDDEEENSKQLERRVKALEIGRSNNPWPGALGTSTQWAVTQFEKLSPSERLQAEERRDDYLAACGGKPVSLGVYFRDRKFLDIAARKAVLASTGSTVVVPMFGPAWAAARMIALRNGPKNVDLPPNIRQTVMSSFEVLAKGNAAGARRYAIAKGLTIADDGGLIFPADFEWRELQRRQITEGFPEVNRLHEAGKGISVDARYAAMKDHCEAVPVGSEVWEDWRQWHGEQVYPWLPETGAMRVVWFPTGGPSAIFNFEEHAKEVFNGRD